MKEVTLPLPIFAFVVATRAALAFGAGLLLSARIPERRRKALGAALVAFGAATTIPAARSVFRHVRELRH